MRVLNEQSVQHTLHPYVHGDAVTSYGEEASNALGISGDRIFKTLVLDVESQLVVVVVPVREQVDLKAAATAVGRKRAALASQTLAERTTGYVAGGISPIGQRKQLPTVVDSSALGFQTVYVSAGRRGLQVELSPGDLVSLTRATVADVTR
ncbi:MAG: Cys-tRNA(Pro) deacylase [Actinomycetes bacterium]